ncbi:hypothetical protein RCC89_18005 [Cytophagaceae bacterium ABcell3]|nr:hypothetical protein RCC89_18005 [Cytophagaceae bacterium ABcell3]
MDVFNREELEKLAEVRNESCVSIYINTHRDGEEANNRTDILSLKNELLKLRSTFRDRNWHENQIEELLGPAFRLLEDVFFWQHQDKGLAIFLYPGYIKSYKVPIDFQTTSYISREFILNQMFPLLTGNGEFFLLSLSKENTRFFKADMHNIQEITHEAKVPETMDSTLKYYEFGRKWQKGTSGNTIIGTSAASPNGSPGNVIFHSHGGDTVSENDYIFEYFRYVNNEISKTLNEHKLPLVVAGVDYFIPLYERANTYDQLIPEAIKGNFDHTHEHELHQKACEIMGSRFNKPFKKSLEKYSAFAGTGKTSYELEDIYLSAKAGRIETLFIEEGAHIWGDYEEERIKIHSSIRENTIDFINESGCETVKNSGDVYIVPKEKMPVTDVSPKMCAIYRY